MSVSLVDQIQAVESAFAMALGCGMSETTALALEAARRTLRELHAKEIEAARAAEKEALTKEVVEIVLGRLGVQRKVDADRRAELIQAAIPPPPTLVTAMEIRIRTLETVISDLSRKVDELEGKKS
jgi:pantoate kinase